MAVDDNLGDFLTNIADTIRSKKNTTGEINAQSFSAEIASIETGSSHTHENKTILDNTTASYTTEEKTKLAGLSNYDDTEVKNSIAANSSAISSETTARESADTTLQANIDKKVDKVEGKGLSTNDYDDTEKSKVASNTSARHGHNNKEWLDMIDADVFDRFVEAGSMRHSHSNKSVLDNTTASYTTAEQTKLSGIASGAEVNVQADWNVTDTTSDAYIKNKPNIPAGTTLYSSTGQNTDGAMTQKATTDALAKKMDNFSISIGSTNVGNPRQVKFMSINYTTATSEAGVSIKLSMVSGHGNGSSYRFLQDAILGVTYTGGVSVDVYKYYNASVGTFDGAARNYGDIFYVKDETNKIVDFYVLLGQYSTVKVTPYFRLNSSTGGVITQLSGTPTYYSSGTKVYGNNSLYAKKSDIPSVSQSTGTSTTEVMSQKATTEQLTSIITTLSNKFTNHSQSAYDCNTCYDEGVYLIARGSNCPSGSQYGSLFVMPYRKPTGNTKPDFCTQIYLPNGDDSTDPNSMFYRTSLADSWNPWQKIIINNPTITITQDGNLVGSFTLNQSSAETFNLNGGISNYSFGGTDRTGYIRFCNGLQIAWGKAYYKNRTYSYAAPFAQNGSYSVAGVSAGWTGSYGNYGMSNLTASGFYLNADKDYDWCYVAIGVWKF